MNKRQEPLPERVLSFIRQHRLLTGGETLVVAVSGGPDSVCLLHILVQLQDKLNLKLHVAHLNHRLRGTDSEADADYVSMLAKKLGIPGTIGRYDVTTYKSKHHLSLEEAAREVRYAFLAKVAAKQGSGPVAVGHTRDDHLETILMHIIRGTGIKGLRGLQPITNLRFPKTNLTVVRPILSLSREETVKYCRQHHLNSRLDASNLSLRPLRNRIRLELIPLLKSYNAGADEALLRLSRLAADALVFIEGEVERLWNEVTSVVDGNIAMEKKKFFGLAPAIQRDMLRECIDRLLGTLKDIEERHIEEIMLALSMPAGNSVDLPGGLCFVVEYQRYLLGFDLSGLAPYPLLESALTLKVPGETKIPGWIIKAVVLDRKPFTKELASNELSACFDLDKTGRSLEVRAIKPGDRFQPLGMSRLKKVGEFMIDAKIPRHWRKRIPIICSPGQIIWITGWRIDERVKVTDKTRRVLCLKMIKQEELNGV